MATYSINWPIAAAFMCTCPSSLSFLNPTCWSLNKLLGWIEESHKRCGEEETQSHLEQKWDGHDLPKRFSCRKRVEVESLDTKLLTRRVKSRQTGRERAKSGNGATLWDLLLKPDLVAGITAGIKSIYARFSENYLKENGKKTKQHT